MVTRRGRRRRGRGEERRREEVEEVGRGGREKMRMVVVEMRNSEGNRNEYREEMRGRKGRKGGWRRE